MSARGSEHPATGMDGEAWGFRPRVAHEADLKREVMVSTNALSRLIVAHPHSVRTEGLRLVHRLIFRLHGISPNSVLNEGPPPAAVSFSVAGDLLRLARAMRAEAYDPARGLVDYRALAISPAYAEFRECSRRLRSFDLATLNGRETRLAFWINLYNALIVDAVIQCGVRQTVNEVPGFFWRAAYAIGGLRFCAFDIEYGILRANAPHPAIPGAHFGPRDPRRRHRLAGLDPRIHFALVCAARSCPPIAVYEPERIDAQLDLAARAFINGGGVAVDRGSGEVRLSPIFQWYAPDFGARPWAPGDRRPLLEFVTRYLWDNHHRELALRGKPKVRFLAYDWSLNLSNP